MNLQELICKKRTTLKPCETLVTLPSGKVMKESGIGCGECSSALVGMKTGYVIDNKPDLQVAHITPGLCMGSQDVVASLDLLEKHRISHILSLGIRPELNKSEISHLYVPLLDIPQADFETAFQQSLLFIRNAIKIGSVVFVHCNAGISRSASIVIGYLINEGMSFDEAYKLVKSKRDVIKPNKGFLKYLKEFEGRKTRY